MQWSVVIFLCTSRHDQCRDRYLTSLHPHQEQRAQDYLSAAARLAARFALKKSHLWWVLPYIDYTCNDTNGDHFRDTIIRCTYLIFCRSNQRCSIPELSSPWLIAASLYFLYLNGIYQANWFKLPWVKSKMVCLVDDTKSHEAWTRSLPKLVYAVRC